MSPNTAVAMEDIIQYEMFRESSEAQVVQAARDALVNLQDHKTLEVESLYFGEIQQQQQLLEQQPVQQQQEMEPQQVQQQQQLQQQQEMEPQQVQQQQQLEQPVPVIYTPNQGNRPYKDSPIPYINAASFRQAIRSVNSKFYTTR